ncbi:bifunctional adenosylcobinamide kinase/adenosylcobinamide-phosphate guanylyltransferase [Rhodococcus tibetensis]|uniref:Adenosylcobinamide kinase n=1 Tax=Rhodococcus tibetensis TaxID=2965064 RepID=A0ABT1QB92_9NOCA|nr:bifunctional adenosylcobinamide kinase/adenosylcobinamide-phosphate guanylyltransferase [Rhodococcus sp. FXJ9.536]MCQ4118995.1 bifunctional adenosylcobinamide kinase/adenosylcobinamide-phosphate guanylyltransferase [Rhodococcus sp. FXJ9.536]
MPLAEPPNRPDLPHHSSRTLILGGARSGKSAYAEQLARTLAGTGSVRYLATSHRDPSDVDWEDRVEQHRTRRPATWTTIETAPGRDLAVQLRSSTDTAVTLVDDLGTWLTVEVDAADAWDLPRGTIAGEVDELVASVHDYRGDLILVTPEVGLGVIPETRSGRLFRDEIGALNAQLAEVCDRAVLVVAGLTVNLKDLPAANVSGTDVPSRTRGPV